MTELPTWVWDMLIQLEDQRDVHPKLYGPDGAPLDWCPCAPLDRVPTEVLVQARAIRAYAQAKKRETAEVEG